jgi:hypothetical protein
LSWDSPVRRLFNSKARRWNPMAPSERAIRRCTF